MSKWTRQDKDNQSYEQLGTSSDHARRTVVTDPTTGAQAHVCDEHGISVCPSSDYFFEISKGDIPNHEGVTFQGYNDEVTSNSAPEDIIEQGGLVQLDATAVIDSISSTDTGDTSTVIQIGGMDANWNRTIQQVTLNGQNTVTLTTPLIRVNAMTTISNEPQGDVYLYVNGASVTNGEPDDVEDIRIKMPQGTNIGYSGVFSCPDGYTAYVFNLYVSLLDTRRAECYLQAVLNRNGIEYVIGRGSIAAQGDSIWTFEPPFPLVIQARDSAWVRCVDTSATCGLTQATRIILVQD